MGQSCNWIENKGESKVMIVLLYVPVTWYQVPIGAALCMFSNATSDLHHIASLIGTSNAIRQVFTSKLGWKFSKG